MLVILFLVSCLGTLFYEGGIVVAEHVLPYSLADTTRTSVAYGNSAFLARYGLATPFAGPALPVGTAGVYGGLISSEPHVAAVAAASPVFAARTAVAASPYFAARTAVAAPAFATVTGAPAIAAVTAAPAIAAVTAAPLLAHAAVRTSPLIASSPVISSVQHVPAVAQVPVTKYEAQPAVIQNVLDVANPKVATRKFEIRRPAIQKEFYDIEERVVVRPAGSAVVELDQPISKNQRGPTLVSPAGPSATVGIRTLPLAPALHTPVLPAFPAVSIQGAPIHHHPVSSPVAITPIPQQTIVSTTQRPDFAQFDDDSVSIENPELGTARIAQQEYRQEADLRAIIAQQEQRQEAELRARIAQQQQQQEAEARARIAQQQQQQEAEARARVAQQQQQQEAEARARVAQQQAAEARARSEAEYRAQQEFQARARIQAQQQLIEQQQHQTRYTAQQAVQRQSIAPAPVSEAPEVRSRISNINAGGLVRSSAHEIPSVRNLPEVELSNQARLIALLTERGPVSEVRSAEGLSASVRARVLSATPAPFDAAPQDEKVSTRRVVVNRPIQTVQEVDVVEPFTKFERIAVNQPALINTARVGVANVPTSLPVQTFSHAHYAL